MSKDKKNPANLSESTGTPKIKKVTGKTGSAAASANIPTMELAPGTKKTAPKKAKGK